MEFLSKSLAFILVFLFLFSPIAPVLAETTDGSTSPAPVVDSMVATPDTVSSGTTVVTSPDTVAPATDQATEEADSPTTTTTATATDVAETIQPYNLLNVQKTFQPKTDLNTGALIFDYPIEVPPGRNGQTPDIKLQYNSRNNFNDSPFGYGWTVNIPYIERINKTGTNNLYTENYFYSSTDGELVNQGNGNFTPKTESGSFSKYTFSDNQWLVTDKQGVTYKFGYSSSTRQDDPNDSTRIFKWMLEEIRDLKSNIIIYTYFKDAGQIYPSIINYSGFFEVEFLRVSRVDINKSYATTFLVTTNYRINEIQTKVNGVWVKKYTMGYTTGDAGVRSLLGSIIESGQDENSVVTTLPAISFDYYKSVPGWTLDTKTYTTPTPFHNGFQNMLDINGDALPDIIESYKENCNPGQGIIKNTYINNNNKTWFLNNNLQPPILFRECEIRGGAYGAVWDQGVRVGDVNGDALPDIIQGLDAPAGFSGSSYTAYLNRGGENWLLSPAWAPTIGFTQTSGDDWTHSNGSIQDYGSRMLDLNGDGLSDITRKEENYSISSETQINIGNSFDTFTTDWNPPVFLTGPYTQFTDVNSDGLPDMIYMSHDLQFAVWTRNVYLNKGDGIWVKDNSFLPPLDIISFNGNVIDAGIRFFDINGDGLVDAVPQSSLVYRGEHTYLNTGTSWAKTTAWNLPEDGVNFSSEHPVSIVDLNTDGSLDFFTTQNSIPMVTLAYINKTTTSTDILKKITFPQGGDTTINYKKSAKYYDNSNNLLNPNLPLNLTTVFQIITSDGNGNSATTSYSYEGGSYFFNTPTDRKFAGFAKVTKINSDGVKMINYFHQGNTTNSSQGEYDDHSAKIGKIYRAEITDNSGNLYSKTINKWDDFNLGNGSKFVKLAQTVSFAYDDNSTHKDTAEGYVYDNTNGNLISKINYGEVDGSDDGSFSDIGNDKFTENISYATNTTNNVVGLPSADMLFDQNVNKIKETNFYYDNLSLGSVGVGNQTKVENWKSGVAYVNTQKVYNSYGLVTDSIDANNNTTHYTYDSFNLYPATVTDALTHTTQYQYDYSSSKVKQTIDQNGFVYQTIFDGLGRVLQEKIPDLVFPYAPVLKTQYFYTDTPNAVSVHKTDYLNGSNTVDAYQYFDGLGRLIQERKEAEIPGNFNTNDIIYNNVGLVQKQSLKYASAGSAKTSPTSDNTLYANYTYDPLQRVLSNSNAVGAITNTYDDWKTTVTDANGKQKNYYKDAYDNLVKVEEINVGNVYATNYEYDLNKNLTKITDALGNIRNFTYDGLGRRLTTEDLHTPADTTFGTYAYTYDDAGNIVQTINPKDQTIDYTYDDLNRVLTENETADIDAEIIYTYDSCEKGIGKLCAVTMTSGVDTSYTYDSNGNTASEVKTISSNSYTTSYSYDKLGNQISITNPDNSQVKYIYNSAGLLNQIQRKEATDSAFSDVVTNFDYSPMEQPTTIAYANGVITTNTYDPAKLYRLTRKLSQNTTPTNLQDLNYTYDNVGNITKIIDASNTDTAKTSDYVYDDLYRLTSATITNVAVGQNPYTENYTYNPIGNILTKNGSLTSVYDGNIGINYANPHAATSINNITQSYDKNGNLLNDGTLANTWNYKNQLVKTVKGNVTSIYDYDQNGQRVKLTNGSTTTVYPSKFYNINSNSRITKRIYGNNILLADITSGTPLGGTTESCMPPATGDWIIDTSCTYTGSALAPASVIINTGKVLTLSPTSKLLIDFKHYKLLVKKTGGVLIKKGSTFRQVKTTDTDTTPVIAYILTDHLGSTNIATKSDGTITETLDYYPYGSQRISSGTYSPQRQYIGQIYDAETSLNYLQARYYNSKTGKFISEDPVFWNFNQAWLADPQNQNSGRTTGGLNSVSAFGWRKSMQSRAGSMSGWAEWLADPQMQNSYSYGRNNPITMMDPDGKFAIQAIGTGLGFLGGFVGQYGSDVIGNLSSGKNGISALAPTSSGRDYLVSGGRGALVGLSTSLGGIGAGAITSLGTSIGVDYVEGKNINYGGAALESAVTLGTGGLLSSFGKVVGREPGMFTQAFFSGKHTQAELIKEAIGGLTQFTAGASSSIIKSTRNKKD